MRPENFTSFLRVCCGRYLALQLDGLVPADRTTPIASLDAQSILAREERGYAKSRPRISRGPSGAIEPAFSHQPKRQPEFIHCMPLPVVNWML